MPLPSRCSPPLCFQLSAAILPFFCPSLMATLRASRQLRAPAALRSHDADVAYAHVYAYASKEARGACAHMRNIPHASAAHAARASLREATRRYAYAATRAAWRSSPRHETNMLATSDLCYAHAICRARSTLFIYAAREARVMSRAVMLLPSINGLPPCAPRRLPPYAATPLLRLEDASADFSPAMPIITPPPFSPRQTRQLRCRAC